MCHQWRARTSVPSVEGQNILCHQWRARTSCAISGGPEHLVPSVEGQNILCHQWRARTSCAISGGPEHLVPSVEGQNILCHQWRARTSCAISGGPEHLVPSVEGQNILCHQWRARTSCAISGGPEHLVQREHSGVSIFHIPICLPGSQPDNRAPYRKPLYTNGKPGSLQACCVTSPCGLQLLSSSVSWSSRHATSSSSWPLAPGSLGCGAC